MCSPAAPSRATLQVNFVMPIICAVLSLVVAVSSWVLVSRQRRAAAKSRVLQASASINGEDMDLTPVDATGAEARLPETMHLLPSHGKSPGSSAAGLRFELIAVTVLAPVGGRVLLDGCTATYPPGQFCAVVGASGSGKSVLLNTLRGRCPGQVRDDQRAAPVSRQVPRLCLSPTLSPAAQRASDCKRLRALQCRDPPRPAAAAGLCRQGGRRRPAADPARALHPLRTAGAL